MLANPLSLSLHGLGQRMQFGQLKRREFITLSGGVAAVGTRKAAGAVLHWIRNQGGASWD